MAKPFECMGFQACVPAVDTGTQYRLAFLGLETPNPDQCPAVDAGIAPHSFNHAPLDHLEARDVYQAAQYGLSGSLV